MKKKPYKGRCEKRNLPKFEGICATYIGIGMLDATICDIYLVNEQAKVVGRPILTACIDANSGLCCGYTLSWEGGTYSLRSLMLHVLTDKVEHCRKFGIEIHENIWPCEMLPGRLVTDMGTEYTSGTFAQICELGVNMTNLRSLSRYAACVLPVRDCMPLIFYLQSEFFE